jgi:hypothetical protein
MNLPEDRKAFVWPDFEKAGMSRYDLRRLVRAGALLHPTFGSGGPELGLWVTPEAEDDPDLPEAAVCLMTGGVLCRGYAAVRHGLSNDTGGFMEIAVPYASNPKRRPHLLVHRTRDERVLTLGVDETPTDLGIPIRMTNPVRTIVDLLRSRGRVGEEWRHGMDSLRAYLGQAGDTEALYDMARELDPGILRTIETAAEAFNGGGMRP